MRTLNFSIALSALICIFCFQSCSKSSDVTPTPTPILPDTLTTGWSKVVIAGETSVFSDIFFNSSTTGYLIGLKVYKSTDGGNTWLPVYTPTANLINLFMTADGKTFLASNSTNAVVKTIDGGINFTSSPVGSPSIDIFFIDNNTGYCIARDGLYTTIDGGITWTKITTTGLPSSSSGYSTLSIINNTTGWIAFDGVMYKSNGSLANWQLSNGTGGAQILSIYATSPSIVYAVDGVSIFKSIDGGANFSLLKNFNTTGFADVHFLDNLNGYVSIGRYVFKTTDGGVNWTKVVSLGQGELGELHFTDATHGWVCSNNGVVLIFKL